MYSDRNKRFNHTRNDNVPPELRNVILTSSNIADRFVRKFFPVLDTERDKLSEYISQESAIVWLGNPLGGRDFLAMYATMPSYTRHEFSSYDVHPLPSPAPLPVSIALADGRVPASPSDTQPQNQSSQQVIINASGKVKIGEERGKNWFGFAAVFVIVQHPTENGKMIVKSMSYRYTYKPDDATITV